ncbi:MAG: PadR family transcriptional regulator [Dokdonella sp.]
MTELEAHLKKFQKELSAGTVSLVLLAVLAQADEPMYGYMIAKRLEAAGDSVLAGKQSALYPVLRNLSAAGLLDSEVEPSISGPPRRYYSITRQGRGVLAQWIASWSATRAFVEGVIAEGASRLEAQFKREQIENS